MRRERSFSARRRRLLGAGLMTGIGVLTSDLTRASPDDPRRIPGRTLAQTGGYGTRSKYATEVRRKGTANGLTGGSSTPLAEGHGIVTPSGLHFEVHRNGVPDIDPTRHRLLVHGHVNSERTFSMSDLMRFPAVSRFHFLECAGNSWSEWDRPTGATVQQTHGLTSCSEWTGVPLSIVLDELGVRRSARWLLAEGGDAAGVMRSIPLAKAMDDALLVYTQNGERLRPEQGFPLRLLTPGYEGNMNIKWLRRLELGDKPWWTRAETTTYADPMPDGRTRVFSFEMSSKSVITSPSGGMRLGAPGFHEIRGLAWSGLGRIRRVEVSTDGGRHWHDAVLQDPVLPKCHTRFRLPWRWNGQSAVIQSRATDETGNTQPTLAVLHEQNGLGPNHFNAIQSWRVDRSGEVSNVHHT